MRPKLEYLCHASRSQSCRNVLHASEMGPVGVAGTSGLPHLFLVKFALAYLFDEAFNHIRSNTYVSNVQHYQAEIKILSDVC